MSSADIWLTIALLTFATIGDEATQKQVDRARAGVRVEKK